MLARHFSFVPNLRCLRVFQETFHRSAHPTDFISPSQMVSRPPYHATAKGRTVTSGYTGYMYIELTSYVKLLYFKLKYVSK